MSARTQLYRHFDSNGVLLYVGISYSAFTRLSQHAADKHWVDEIANMTIETFDTREQALYAEKAAIQNEKPLHNVIHNKPKKAVKQKKVVCEDKTVTITYSKQPEFRSKAKPNGRSYNEVGIGDLDFARDVLNGVIVEESERYAMVSIPMRWANLDAFPRYRMFRNGSWVGGGLVVSGVTATDEDVVVDLVKDCRFMLERALETGEMFFELEVTA